MKTNAKFKMIASIASVILIIVGIFVPAKVSMPIEIIGMTTLFVLSIIKWIVPSEKNTILKLLGLIVLYLGALSWTIPAATFQYGEFQSLGLERMSLFNLIDYPYLSIQFFLQPLLFILAVGGLYGVLSETGKFRNTLDKIVKKLKGKEEYFLIGSSLILTLVSALFAVNVEKGGLFGPNLVLFLIIPTISAIILLMGYDKMTAFLASFISPIIGIIGGIYSPATSYINDVVGSDYSTELIWKIALLVICYTLYLFVLLKQSRKSKERKSETKEEKDESKNDIPLLGEKKQSKKASWPIFLILGLLILVMILGMFNWEKVFEISWFTDLHTSITEFEIADHRIFNYLIAGITSFGSWSSLSEITVLTLAATLIISLIYKFNFETTINSFIKGVKQVLKPVIIMTLAYTIVIITAYNPFFMSITDWLINSLGGGIIDALGKVGFLSGAMEAISQIVYVLVSGIDTIISTILNIDILYVIQSGLPYLVKSYPDGANSLAIITQSLHGLTLMIAPTSALMIVGLEYLGISYKEWLKTSWKLVLELLAIILIVILIVVFI